MRTEQFTRIINEIEGRIGEGEAYELRIQTLGPYLYHGPWIRHPHDLIQIKDTVHGDVYLNMEMVVAIGLGDPL